jgi:hypothetical protein
MPLATKF